MIEGTIDGKEYGPLGPGEYYETIEFKANGTYVEDLYSSVNTGVYTYDAENKYYCPHCHSEMYPTFGPKQEHHFRHNGTQCQHDSHLHSVAEKMFQEEYLKCLENNEPFILELHSHVACDRNCTEKKNRICTSFHNTSCIDLTKIYTNVKLETNVSLEDGRFRRPDILLSSEDGEQLWIEIWVKHETKEEKRNDGHIIELKITTEKDLEQIKSHKLTKTTDNELAIRLFNVEFGDDCIISSTTHDFNPDTIEWIDLGLPSGTLWAKEDSKSPLPFSMARNRYSLCLPSRSHAQELKEYCKRSWDSRTNRVQFIGPNGIPLQREERIILVKRL